MAMRRQEPGRQEQLFVPTAALAQGPGHPFYEKLNAVLAEQGFDAYVEGRCAVYYAPKIGRPSIPPGVYFRVLMVGYFEGLDSERGIDWRVSDSLSLRRFLGYDLSQATPDHSSLSRIRHRLPLEVHQEVFAWVLTVLAKAGLLQGQTLGVDASTLEANAALRSIVRRDSGQTYGEYLTGLAQASGIETPTRQQLAQVDRQRPHKGSNQEWRHPYDPEARIAKMKDGRTHLAHKVEHAVDLQTQAIVAVALHGADQGDTTTLEGTLLQAQVNLAAVATEVEAERQLADQPVQEVVADKGYHSDATVTGLQAVGIRGYLSEPDRGRRRWRGDRVTRRAVYANRRRLRGRRGRALHRRRAEYVERSFAHTLETGGLRRVHLRGRDNILKRLLIHVGACNLGLVMRRLFGMGTPRGLWDLISAVSRALGHLCGLVAALWLHLTISCRLPRGWHPAVDLLRARRRVTRIRRFSSGC
jgi:transposase